jgi:hypothetical protein
LFFLYGGASERNDALQQQTAKTHKKAHNQNDALFVFKTSTATQTTENPAMLKWGGGADSKRGVSKRAAAQFFASPLQPPQPPPAAPPAAKPTTVVEGVKADKSPVKAEQVEDKKQGDEDKQMTAAAAAAESKAAGASDAADGNDDKPAPPGAAASAPPPPAVAKRTTTTSVVTSLDLAMFD